MTQPEFKARTAVPIPASLLRLLSCIRMDEVCVLQGAPVLGACFAMTGVGVRTWALLAGLVVGNVLLVAHVFVLNDWSGVQGDLKDPTRAAATYAAKGESSIRMAALALALLALSLLVFGLLDHAALGIALVIAALSAVYSMPGIHGKGRPVLNSALHLSGGTLHFLLGFAVFSPVSPYAIVIGCYFGLVFAAGHLTHETRDHDGDLYNEIRTNAVAFGKQRAFVAGLLLFSAAYVVLVALALLRLIPHVLACAIVLYAVHLLAAWRAWRDGLTYASVRRLQTVYRNIHAIIGVTMLITVPPW